jgi:EmrB/QacA subfamily drug resistance transporter
MKSSFPIIRLQGSILLRRVRVAIGALRIPTCKEGGGREQNARAILIGLMAPTVMVVLSGSMFSVALPAIRTSLDAKADLLAWVVTGFTLSFVVFMPLYGRLGDGFGMRKPFLAGIIIFLLGTAISALAVDLRVLLLGRAIQGAGAAGVTPLAIAMISEFFPARQRGQALGTWNSVGPAAGMVGPVLAGLLVDNWSWRAIFGPILLIGLTAVVIARRCIPAADDDVPPGFLRGLDWGGAILLAAAVTASLFYISSKLITGVDSLHDWRLLGLASLLFGGFVLWEKRRPDPFVSLGLFADRLFTRSSVCAGVRMFTMSGIGFLMPLYLADVFNLNSALIGVTLVIHAGALLATMRMGGQVADRWGSRRPVVLGLCVQVLAMTYFAVLRGSVVLPLVLVGVAAHGLGAGLAMAALHRAAMGQVPQTQTGVAAGLYSMIRFAGTVLGITLGGVLLQQGLDREMAAVDAYHSVYWFLAGVGFLGVLIGLTLRE